MKKEHWNQIVSDLQQNGFKSFHCPVCKNNNFNLLDDIIPLISVTGKRNISLNEYIPAAGIVCSKCGHISMFAVSIASPTVFKEMNEEE